MKLNHLHKITPAWLLITAAVFISAVFCVALAGAVFANAFKNKIMPGVVAGSVEIGTQSPVEARTTIEQEIERLQEGVPVRFADKQTKVPGTTISPNPDLPVAETVSFDADETLRRAWAVGRSGNWLIDIVDQARGLFIKRQIPVALEADQAAMQSMLETEFSSYNKPAHNASIVFENNVPKIVAEENGQRLVFEKTIPQIIKQLSAGNLSEITIKSEQDMAEVSAAEATGLIPEIESYIDLPSTELWYGENKWTLKKENAKSWLGFAKEKNKAVLALDKTKITEYLTKEVAPKIDKEPVEARLAMEGTKVSVWQSGEDGLKLSMDQSADRIAAWPTERPEKIELAVEKIASNSSSATAEELGLKEIIGTGTSQFAGSPANRRHNIKTGANALNGLLIKPGEEFSLLKALGNIDGKNGYLQELVIKEGKTIPEYGGGLCQIGTTMFRATFNSGLPVTQRKNHSYRVVYYEPAGTDATIYDPAPDYRFVNDTGHYILIQARMSGNSLAFDFWGTKDDRKVEVSKPVIYNIVAPAPTKIIETTDLKEGEKRCTEKAHAGADAYFDYKVSYPNGEVKEKRFSSHYVPWQAVCLVGAKKTTDGSVPPPSTGTITPSASPAN
jgi:vancomycin resistance protein YoaR